MAEKLPKREMPELVWALRERAKFIENEKGWTVPATVAMMREAADAIEAMIQVHD